MLAVAIIIQSAVPHPIFNCTDLGLYPYNYPSREVIPSGKRLNSGYENEIAYIARGKEAEAELETSCLCCALTPVLYDLPLHQVQGHYKNKGECPGLIKALSSTGEIRTAYVSMYQGSTGHQKQSVKRHEDQKKSDSAPGSERSAANRKLDFEEERGPMS